MERRVTSPFLQATRFLDTMGMDSAYTDSYGRPRVVDRRNGLQFQKVMGYFKGCFLTQSSDICFTSGPQTPHRDLVLRWWLAVIFSIRPIGIWIWELEYANCPVPSP